MSSRVGYTECNCSRYEAFYPDAPDNASHQVVVATQSHACSGKLGELKCQLKVLDLLFCAEYRQAIGVTVDEMD